MLAVPVHDGDTHSILKCGQGSELLHLKMMPNRPLDEEKLHLDPATNIHHVVWNWLLLSINKMDVFPGQDPQHCVSEIEKNDSSPDPQHCVSEIEKNDSSPDPQHSVFQQPIL